jgi:hypothetical protein
MPSAFESVGIGLCPAGFCVVGASGILCLRLLGPWSEREGVSAVRLGRVEIEQTWWDNICSIMLVEVGTISFYVEIRGIVAPLWCLAPTLAGQIGPGTSVNSDASMHHNFLIGHQGNKNKIKINS